MSGRVATLVLIALLVIPVQVAGARQGTDGLVGDSDKILEQPETSQRDQAPGDDLTGDNDNKLGEFDATATRVGTFVEVVPPVEPVVDATISLDNGPGPTQDAGEESGGADDNCAEYSPEEYDVEQDITYSAVCIKWRVCGQERIDDVVSGDIAGEDAAGRYKNYLGEMTGYLASDTYLAQAGINDVNSVNDFLLTQGLGEQPGQDLIAVFNWCANQDATGVLDPVDLSSVSFTWTLRYEDVYDIPGVRSDLYSQLTALIGLYNPEIGTVPPIERGYTFVQWPTWLFLKNPVDEKQVYTTNDTDTFRIDLRAVLLSVEWAFGDESIASCTGEQMTQYDADKHHPIEDLPPCHHVFDQLGTNDLTTTIVYKIQERVRNRLSKTLNQYPNTPWADYYGTPTTVELSTTVDDYEIHQIISVNVPEGMTSDEIRDKVFADANLPGS